MSNFQERVKIAKSFGGASDSYDVSARLQRFSGKHLMPWLPNRHDLTVLDLGCGTGFFTDILASQYEQVIGLDISTKMLNFAKQKRNKAITWVEADAFKLPFADNSLDFIYTNLVIQWCEPLQDSLNEMMRVLKPGGLVAFSTLIDGTLFELKSAWKQVDDDQHVIDFRTLESLESAVNQGAFRLLESKQQDVILEYENVIHLARELKGLGANHVPKKRNKGLAGKDKWQKMETSYSDFQEPGGVYPATYKVYSGLLVKLSD
ncbi:malonyl-ACP O-methyltransferase BioC [Thalassotalea agarivorans]|uniref:Malonyl-[acyl-carrier protein] O-methyltransferase n=1 Tax=Thalassotalea agarivorans TaxID=349064 RepID=A0A1I0F2M4_THASX|nr:malonyl-ACP O-methyltransferase BioC [Thalassotalea agarivorans]SET52078.1 pimeloyl-CoA biosynthesis protein BioC [Thalassotalea agarivorans]